MTIQHDSVWRANVESRSVSVNKLPQSWRKLGGRALIARILLDEGVAGCDPMGPDQRKRL